MKLTFKVVSEKEQSIVSLIKKVNKISCRIYFDIENGIVLVENVGDAEVDTVIETINSYYQIKSVEIDNLENNLKTENEDESKIEGEEVSEVNSTDDNVPANETKVDSESEDEEVDFGGPVPCRADKRLKKSFNKFLASAYDIIHSNNISNKFIGILCGYIDMAKYEMNLRWNTEVVPDISVGNVVKCYLGPYIPGEIGGDCFALVCNISKDMVYVIPIIHGNSISEAFQSYLNFTIPNDIDSQEIKYNSGVILLDRGRYINSRRINHIVGKAEQFFLKEVLEFHSRSLDFRANSSVEDDDSDESDEGHESNVKVEEVVAQPIEKVSKKRKRNVSPKPGSGEAGVYEFYSSAISNMYSEKTNSKKAIRFIKDLGMDSKDKVLVEAFTSACYVNKITYENVADKISDTTGYTASKLVFHMKMAFRKWLKSNPELEEKYPRISLTSFLKVFAQEIS